MGTGVHFGRSLLYSFLLFSLNGSDFLKLAQGENSANTHLLATIFACTIKLFTQMPISLCTTPLLGKLYLLWFSSHVKYHIFLNFIFLFHTSIHCDNTVFTQIQHKVFLHSWHGGKSHLFYNHIQGNFIIISKGISINTLTVFKLLPKAACT